MTPVIFHIDVNSAYLSWTAVEQLKNGAGTDLRKIPSIIGGDQKSRHGVVLAKSIPAKRYGIRTGEPVANAFRKCPNLVIEPPDHTMYREKSRMLMDYLRTFTKEIEQVSVDECYVDMTQAMEGFYSPVDAAMLIKNGVREKFGFTVNVGISSNKLLAKMASDFEKPDKVHTLFPEEIRVKMWPLPIGELYMAGHSSVEILKKLEILTIGDLAQADPRLMDRCSGSLQTESIIPVYSHSRQKQKGLEILRHCQRMQKHWKKSVRSLHIWQRVLVKGSKKPVRKHPWSVWKSNIMISERFLIRNS